MRATERIVKHTRLRADSEASVRRTLLKLEDALRCATLPDAGARVLLVRRLDLGAIPPGVSSQTLSLMIERKIAAAGGTWAHAIDPAADQSDFVFFRDALEARYELALRLARATPCTAWYWRLAVPEYKPAEGAQANLRHIALAIAALPEAPAALPAWIARLTAAGAAPALALTVAPSETATLLRAAALPAVSSTSSPNPEKDRHDARLEKQQAFAGNVVCVTGSSAFAEMPAWLRALAARGGFVPAAQFAPAIVPDPPHDGPLARMQVRSHAQAASLREQPHTVQETVCPQPSMRPVRLLDTVCAPPHANEEKLRAPISPNENGSPADPTAAPALRLLSDDEGFTDLEPTDHGGLLFLLSVMGRLGYATWCDSVTEGAGIEVSHRVLSLALRNVSASPDDAAWQLTTPEAKYPASDIRAQAPPGWTDPVLRPPRAMPGIEVAGRLERARTVEQLAQAWLTACRRWLRRMAHMGIASMIKRPAMLHLTPTHAEVHFRLSATDLRVRRAGLDFDQGWLPWLGRVVSFHYR